MLIALAGVVAVAVLFFVAFTFGNNGDNRIAQNPLPRVPTHYAPLRNPAIQQPARRTHPREHHVVTRRATPKVVTLTVSTVGGDCWVLIDQGAEQHAGLRADPAVRHVDGAVHVADGLHDRQRRRAREPAADGERQAVHPAGEPSVARHGRRGALAGAVDDDRLDDDRLDHLARRPPRGERAPARGVLVTGSELLLGLIQDPNSSFLARELDVLGIELRRVVTVGDGVEDIVAGLAELEGLDLVVTSGGLGPTHDDRTVEAVARAAGAALELDEALCERIGAGTSAYAAQRGLDPESFLAGNRKQSLVPRGAHVLEPVGTAPGLVLPLGGATCVVLPGPPSELGRMWASLVEGPLLDDLAARGARPERRVLRVFGTSESLVADTFAAVGGDSEGTSTTICARRLEIEVLIRAPRERREALDRLADALRSRLGDAVYAEDERTLEEHVLTACREQGLTLALAESCTAGLVAAGWRRCPGRRTCCSAASSPTPTRSSATCSASLPRSSSSTARSRPSAPRRWPPAPAA